MADETKKRLVHRRSRSRVSTLRLECAVEFVKQIGLFVCPRCISVRSRMQFPCNAREYRNTRVARNPWKENNLRQGRATTLDFTLETGLERRASPLEPAGTRWNPMEPVGTRWKLPMAVCLTLTRAEDRSIERCFRVNRSSYVVN